jgi:acyl-CoA synthetase (AMP-forming)/AMP-acid ligase II
VSEIVEAFSRISRDQGSRSVIVRADDARAVTAAALQNRRCELVRRLTSLGLSAGELVIAVSGNQPDLVALLLACRSLNLALMMLEPGTTREEAIRLAARFGAAAQMMPTLPVAGMVEARCDGTRRHYPGAAVLKLTSGSTGDPRATLTTEAQLIADGRQIAASMDIRPADTQMATIPLSHSYGLGVLVMPLLLHGTPIVLRDAFVPTQLYTDAQRFGATRFPGVPFMFEYLLDHPPGGEWPARLARLMSAGAPLPPVVSRAFHRRFGVKIHAFYGTTETGGIAYDDSNDPAIAETVGRALDGVTISLRAEPDLPGGRVHVRSGAVSDGYVDTARSDFDGQGYLTGDYGTIDGDGRLTLLGRVSSFINVAGRKVQPAEVEAALRDWPDVADVRVVGAHDERRGEHVVACIVPRANGERLTTVAMRRFCATRLAPHKIPRAVILVDAIPLTARGKTDREALAALVRSHRPRKP